MRCRIVRRPSAAVFSSVVFRCASSFASTRPSDASTSRSSCCVASLVGIVCVSNRFLQSFHREPRALDRSVHLVSELLLLSPALVVTRHRSDRLAVLHAGRTAQQLG